MPSAGTIHAWKAGRVESVPASVSDDIACAREIGYDVIAANLRNTARGMGDSTNDVQRDKLIIDTDLKLLAKWSKKYADKQTIAGDPDAPIKFSGIDIAFIGNDKT
jgi:hypothetical protein